MCQTTPVFLNQVKGAGKNEAVLCQEGLCHNLKQYILDNEFQVISEPVKEYAKTYG